DPAVRRLLRRLRRRAEAARDRLDERVDALRRQLAVVLCFLRARASGRSGNRRAARMRQQTRGGGERHGDTHDRYPTPPHWHADRTTAGRGGQRGLHAELGAQRAGVERLEADPAGDLLARGLRALAEELAQVVAGLRARPPLLAHLALE